MGISNAMADAVLPNGEGAGAEEVPKGVEVVGEFACISKVRSIFSAAFLIVDLDASAETSNKS